MHKIRHFQACTCHQLYTGKDQVHPFKHYPDSHLPYCVLLGIIEHILPVAGWLRRDGVCMQHTRAKRGTQKEKGSNSAGASMPTSRTTRPSKGRSEKNTRACGEFGSNRHAPPGHTGRVGSPSPCRQTRTQRTCLLLLAPRSTAGPAKTTPAAFLIDLLTLVTTQIVSNPLASGGLVRGYLLAAHPASKHQERPHVLVLVAK
jgi:hypothetical protein